MSEVVGSGFYLTSRQSTVPSELGHHPVDFCDFLGASHLGLAGDMAVLCHRDLVGPLARDLLGTAGLHPARTVLYRTVPEYRDLLAQLPPRRVIFQHVHSPDEVDADRYWISRSLLAYLNDKAAISHLVPPSHAPRRDILHGEAPLPPGWQQAAVKASTWESVAGGMGTRLCTTPIAIRQALAEFRTAPAVVVEELLDSIGTWVLSYAARADGGVDFLGAAQQLSNGPCHTGNLMCETIDPEPVHIGRHVVANAAAQGFVGFAGIDFVHTRTGQWFAVDLNFRLNASTPMTLIGEEHRTPVMLFRRWHTDCPTSSAARAITVEVTAGRLIPLAVQTDPTDDRLVQRVACILRADSTAGLAAAVHRLTTAGLRQTDQPTW
ncbi:hypothetical protein [Streptomyces gibsoniae]|uniref:ATP-grasp domain-containing protein n=1 Tax=Streptomyces gibsoniae TaxID=3075529 RepID=A0ABU2U830_9ACTN|nr:hypothetical protein [Streptomyces sp. DSM 41699]MDT0469320.1 hypothetical protein [Streptomyces sp. DSM 41699]